MTARFTMAITKYTKWIGSPLDGLSLEELLDGISEFFLQSGFSYGFRDISDPHEMEALRQAILEKLVEMGRITEEMLQQWMEDRDSEESQKLDERVSQLIRRLIEEGWVRTERESNEESSGGAEEDQLGSARFELTDKSIDFLGFRLLRQLMGSLGRSTLGRHETAHLSTGVDAYQVSKEYEYGDTLNLDISGTLMRAIAREGLSSPLDLDYSDLMVHQNE